MYADLEESNLFLIQVRRCACWLPTAAVCTLVSLPQLALQNPAQLLMQPTLTPAAATPTDSGQTTDAESTQVCQEAEEAAEGVRSQDGDMREQLNSAAAVLQVRGVPSVDEGVGVAAATGAAGSQHCQHCAHCLPPNRHR